MNDCGGFRRWRELKKDVWVEDVLKNGGTEDRNKDVRKRQHEIMDYLTFVHQTFADHLLGARYQQRCWCGSDKHSLISALVEWEETDK